MFKAGTQVKPIGTFTVKAVNTEYIEIDSWEKGTEESFNQYESSGTTELNDDGSEKKFDGFQVGDFFKFDGVYPVVRSNEIFSKVEVEGHLLSFPNHKLLEVE